MARQFDLLIANASYNAAEMELGAGPASLALLPATPDPNIKLLLHSEKRRLRVLTGLEYTYQPFIDSLGQVWVGRNNTGGGIDVRDSHGNLLNNVATSGNQVIGIAEDSLGHIWAPQFTSDTIDVIDPVTGTILHTITIDKTDNNPGYPGPHAGPYACRFANGAMYVSIQCPGGWGNGYIRKYDINTYAKILDITGLIADSAPHFMTSDATHLFVANERSSSLTKILLADDSVVANIICAGSAPVTPVKDTVNNRIWLTCYADNRIFIINNATNAVLTTITAVTTAFGVVFDGTDMWVSSGTTGQVRKYSLAYALQETVSFYNVNLRGLAYHAAASCIFVCDYLAAGRVYRIKTAVPATVEEDSAQTPHTITVTGAAAYSTDAAFGALARYLDGATRGVVVMTEKLAANDFTLNATIKPLRATNLINERILAWYQNDTNRGFWGIYNNGAGINYMFLGFQVGGVWVLELQWDFAFLSNTVYELEVGRNGSNFYGLANGVKIGATLVDTSPVPTYTNDNVYLDVDYFLSAPNQYSKYIRDEVMIKIGACDHTDSYTPKTAAYAGPYSSSVGSVVTFAELDSGGRGTEWDTATIPYVESIKDDHYGLLKYQYSCQNVQGVPVWNGTWLTWPQLRAVGLLYGRYFQIKTQHSSFTALDSASIGDLSIYADVEPRGAGRSQIGGKSEVFGG